MRTRFIAAGAAAALALGAFASAVAAGSLGGEPPDIDGSSFEVGAGEQTVTGDVGPVGADDTDTFSVEIPAGLAVTDVSYSGAAGVHSLSGCGVADLLVQSFDPGVTECTLSWALNADELAAEAEAWTVTITAADIAAPVISVPADITQATDAGVSTAVVEFVVTAEDNVDESVAVECLPASGSTFDLGDTEVMCSATDVAGNVGEASFMVTIVDEEPPVITVPADITQATDPGVSTAVVEFEVTAEDNVDESVAVECLPASGSTFDLGDTEVMCSATDVAGNLGEASFTVTIDDEEPPVVDEPADITQATDAGVSTAVVTFDTPAATDNVDGSVAVTCAPASGSTFELGDTIVSCSATDTAGNTGQSTFTVTIVDEEPPEITVPEDFTAPADSLTGATVEYDASATDNVAVTEFGCNPDSGEHFDLGPTGVDCDAADAAGNTASESFEVTVEVAATGDSVDIILDDIAEQDLDNGTATSLGAPLGQAGKLIDDDNESNDKAACNKTEAFLKHVEKKQKQGKISDEYAEDLEEFTDGDYGLRQALDC